MGDPANAALWRVCRIYVSTNLSAAIPADADTAFGVDWDELGLLAQGGPNETPTWGTDEKLFDRNGTIVRRRLDEYTSDMDFGCLEWNSTVRDVVWPGSTDSALYVPRPVQLMFGFEFQELTVVERLITKNYAEAAISGQVSRNESGLVVYPVKATVYADPDSVNAAGEPQVWIRQSNATSS